MMTEVCPWPELALQPDQVIADSQVFHGLRETHLKLTDDQSKNYVLICDTTGLQFEVGLTGVLSQHEDDRDPYRPGKASANLRQVLHDEGGSALSQFLRYSPWLIADLKVEEGPLEPVQHGAVLARLLYLLVTTLEDENLTGGRLRETYWLLLRARFVLLARLHREHGNDMGLYLPDLDLQVREAWRSWGQTLFQSSQEVKLLLARYGCRVDDEGGHLIFVDEHNRELWSFALTAADRPFTLQLLSRWFLPHYDVRRVMRALGQMPRASTDVASRSADAPVRSLGSRCRGVDLAAGVGALGFVNQLRVGRARGLRQSDVGIRQPAGGTELLHWLCCWTLTHSATRCRESPYPSSSATSPWCPLARS